MTPQSFKVLTLFLLIILSVPTDLYSQDVNIIPYLKKIENGKIIGRVKDVTIAGNIYNLLNEQLVAVGNKIITPNSISDAYHVPYLYFKDVSIN